MNTRTEHVDGIGEVKVTKKRGLKRISMRLHPSGQVRVSIPYIFTFNSGFKFAMQHIEWISNQKSKTVQFGFYDGMQIGKKHKIELVNNDSTKIIVKNGIIKVNSNIIDLDLKVKKAIKRALNIEAKEFLPERLEYLAKKYGFNYKGLYVKPMKSRWGACSSTKSITLNCYLMMLPWNLIDYVIVHELSHTKHMNHGVDFWNEVEQYTPNYKELRANLRKIQPQVHSLYV